MLRLGGWGAQIFHSDPLEKALPAFGPQVRKARSQLEGIQAEMISMQKQKGLEAQELNKWSARPEKLRRQTEILSNNLKGLRQQDEALLTKVRKPPTGAAPGFAGGRGAPSEGHAGDPRGGSRAFGWRKLDALGEPHLAGGASAAALRVAPLPAGFRG